MHEIIASFDYNNEEIPHACSNVFYLGVKVSLRRNIRQLFIATSI